MSEPQHALLPPSGAVVWGYCAGSIIASQGRPDKWSQQSDEGTAAHWVIKETLNSDDYDCQWLLGQTAPNGVVIDDKMVDGAQIFVDNLLETIDGLTCGYTLHVEHRLHMPQIHSEHNWGTCDAALIVPGTCHIYVDDYKHGHRIRSARGDLQLIDYVAGVANELGLDGHSDQHWTVVMRVVQPFAYRAEGPVDEWRVTLSDLRPYFNQLQAQAEKALGPSPTLTPGLYCRDCPAVADCAASKDWLYAHLDYVDQPYQIDKLDDHALAVERGILSDAQAVLKARLESIEDDLMHRIQSGSTGSGLTVQAKQGNMEWTLPREQIIAIGQQFGVDLSKPDIDTPAQAKQKVPRKLRPGFESVLKTAARRPSGKLTLVDATDSRSARAFRNHSQEQ